MASENEKTYMHVSDESLRLFKGKGCNSCNFIGYSGRTVVSEVVNIHSVHRKLISRQATFQEIDKASRSFGYENIRDDAFKLVKSGITTFEEAMRVAFQESLE